VIRPLLDRADVTISVSSTKGARPARREVGLARAVGWPEPFRLVVIEALACGTPVARGRAIPEILRADRRLVGDDAQRSRLDDRLDERTGRPSRRRPGALDVGRMVDGYEALYRRLLGASG
jgi:glycosyltransferase involved in cell wall biosynthesis